MIYGVFYSYHECWNPIGYFCDKESAEKYACLLGDDHEVRPMKDLTNEKDLSLVSLKYCYEVLFDKKDKNEWVIVEDSDRYTYYIDDYLHCDCVSGYNQRVLFRINIIKNNKEEAENIARKYLDALLFYGKGTINDRCVAKLNAELKAPFEEIARLKAEEELRQKELAELARLKEKYESN